MKDKEFEEQSKKVSQYLRRAPRKREKSPLLKRLECLEQKVSRLEEKLQDAENMKTWIYGNDDLAEAYLIWLNQTADMPSTQEEKFEQIRKADIEKRLDMERELNDDEYIAYHLWKNEGEKVIFHGGCHGCSSHSIFGIERCRGCQYFRADWGKPNLRT